MALDDALGVGADQSIDPQSLLDNLIAQRSPDLARNAGTVDPQSVLDRLIRKSLTPEQARQVSPTTTTAGQTGAPGAPTDFSNFGPTKEEIDKQPPVDFSAYGEEKQEGQPVSGPIGTLARKYAAGIVEQAGGVLQGAATFQPTGELPTEGDVINAIAGTPGGETAVTNAATPAKSAQDVPAYKAGQAIEQFAKENIAPSQASQQVHPIMATVGGGLGAVTAPLLLGLIDPVAGIAGGAALFGLQGAGDTYDDAIKHGADEDTARQAASLSAAANTALGGLPVANVLKPFKKFAPELSGWAVKTLAQAGENGLVFLGVGEAQTFLGQQIAKEYDPKAGYTFDVNRLVGELLAGGALGAVHGAMAGRGGNAAATGGGEAAAPTAGEATPSEPNAGGGAAGIPPGAEEQQQGQQQQRQQQQQTGAETQQNTGAAQQQQGAPPPPFESTLKPNVRARLEEKAAYYNEFSPDVIRSWSDDDLKAYVTSKFNYGTKKASDEEILRRYGYSDDEIAGMSDEQRAAAMDEALKTGASAGQAPPQPGTREEPVDLKDAADVRAAADMADQAHSPAQGEANNVQRGHATWNGLDITIEAPAGGVRRGVAPDGTPFETQHPHTYGYFTGLPAGADGMHPDVIVGDHPTAPAVFVLDEVDNKTGKFRQTKSFVGFQTWEDAIKSYLATSSKDATQIGGMRAFPRDEFAELARKGLLSQPVSDAMSGENNNVSQGAASAAAPEPTPADHQVIETALRQVGADPAQVRPVDIARAAEIHASEGLSPQDAFQVAILRSAVEDGLMTIDDVRADHGDEAASLVAAGEPSERGLRAAPRGAAAGGEIAAGAAEQLPSGGAHGAPAGNEAVPRSGFAKPVESEEPAGAEAVRQPSEAGATGHPENERAGGGAAERGAPGGNEAPEPANGGLKREGAAANANAATQNARNAVSGGQPFKGMIENADKYRAAAKKRREQGGGGPIKVYATSAERLRDQGLTVEEANAQRAKDRIEYGKKFDAALKQGQIPRDAVPDDVYAGAVDAMIDRGFEPLDALDYIMLKAEREAGWLESEAAIEAAEHIISTEEGRADVAEVSHPAGEAPAAPGAGAAARPAPSGEQAGGAEPSPGAAATGGPERPAAERREPEQHTERREPERRTEHTAVGEQHVLPGAERISDAELAQRRTSERLKPKAEQKPADQGLFSDENKQTDLISGAGVKAGKVENGELNQPFPANILPTPKDFIERIWDNYAKNMSPDEFLESEALWSGARELAREKDISEAEAFSKIANTIFRNMNANRRMTPAGARRYMGNARGIKPAAANEKPQVEAAQKTSTKLNSPDNKPGYALHEFAGEDALTADRTALAKAKELEAANVGPEEIWRQTGWYKRPDGWRFEIDDSKTAFKANALKPIRRAGDDEVTYGYRGRLGDLIDAPQLFAAYPELANIDVGIGDHHSFISAGGIDPHTRKISIGESADKDSLLSTLLHEIQHAIQLKEGFDAGGNSETLGARTTAALYDIARQIEALRPGSNVRAELEQLRDRLRQQADIYGGGSLAGFASTDVQRDAYRRLLGEVEARNTEARRKLTATERRASFPRETEDIPPEEQYSGRDLVTLDTKNADLIDRAVRENYDIKGASYLGRDVNGPRTEWRGLDTQDFPERHSNIVDRLEYSPEGIAEKIKLYGATPLRDWLSIKMAKFREEAEQEQSNFDAWNKGIGRPDNYIVERTGERVQELEDKRGLARQVRDFLDRLIEKHPELGPKPGYHVRPADREGLVERYRGRQWTKEEFDARQRQIEQALYQLREEGAISEDDAYKFGYDFDAQGLDGEWGANVSYPETFAKVYARAKQAIDEYRAARDYLRYRNASSAAGLSLSMDKAPERFSPVPGTPIARQAQDFVVRRGLATGREHLVAIDAAGGVIGQAMGKQRSVAIPDQMARHFVRADMAAVVHHNHPEDSTLSNKDIAMLGLPGLRAIWAHGLKSRVSRAELTKFGRSIMRRDDPGHNVTVLRGILSNVSADILKTISPLVKANKLSPSRAADLDAYIGNEVLRRAGLIHYQTNDRFEKEIGDFHLEPSIDALRRQLAAALPTLARGPPEADAGRNAEPVFRHPGDVGATFERATPAAGQRAGQEGGHSPRGANDPAEEEPPIGSLDLLKAPERRYPAPPFYSAVSRAIENAKQDKAAPNAWLGMIRNTPGVKADEIAWLGLEDWLRDHKGPVTKTELADYVRAHQVEVHEVEKTQLGPRPTVRQGDAILDWAEGVDRAKLRDAQTIIGDFEENRIDGREAASRLEELGAPDDLLLPYRNYAGGEAGPKFKQYTLPGGENYRELLLMLPTAEQNPQRLAVLRAAENRAVEEDDQFEAERVGRLRESEEARGTFKSSHWDEPNVLAHIRFDDRMTDGKKTLHVAEIQSDWGQSLRKSATLRAVSKPESVRELGNNFFGRELAASIPLDEMDGGVLALAQHNEVKRAIISLLPVDVVDQLGGAKLASEKFLRDPAVIFKALPVDRRASIAQVVLDAARQVVAEARAKLSNGLQTGSDIEILPALRASQLTAREVVGVLAPEGLYHVGLPRQPIRSDVTLGRTKEAASAGPAKGDRKGLPATDAEFLNTPLSASVGTVARGRRPAGPDGEPAPAIVAEALNWHNHILGESGVSTPVEYKPSNIPPQPFSTTWPELALKRMIRYAAENGYDRLSWDTGATNAERYDLSKQVGVVRFDKFGTGGFDRHEHIDENTAGQLTAFDHDGREIMRRHVEAEDLPDYIGKDIADKLLAQEGKYDRRGGMAMVRRKLEGLDLKVGGKGMLGFYDDILPAAAKKLTKKFGGQVGASNLEAGEEDKDIPFRVLDRNGQVEQRGIFDESHAARRAEEIGGTYEFEPQPQKPQTKVHTLDITPELREAAVHEGFALHAPASRYGAATGGPTWRRGYRYLTGKIADWLGSPSGIKATEGLSDYSHRIRLLQNQAEALYNGWVAADGRLPDEQQFYVLKRLFPGKRADRVDVFNKQHFDPLAKFLRANGITLKAAGDYVYAKHAPERNRVKGRLYEPGHPFNEAIRNPDVVGASGMSSAQARQIAADFERGKPDAARELLRRVADIRHFIQSEMLRGGLESLDAISEWNRTYDHYVPLKEWDDPSDAPEGAELGRGRGSGDVRGPESRYAFGRRTKADNPLAHLISQAYRTIDRAERNRVYNAMANAFAGLSRAEAPIGATLGVRLQRGRPTKVIDRDTGLVRTVDSTADRYGDNAVMFKRNGAPRYFVFDDRNVAQAARTWSPMQLPGPLHALLWLTNKLKSLWTHYSPDFLVRHNARYYVESVLNAMELKETGAHSALTHARQALPVLGSATRAIFAVERGEDPARYAADPEMADLMRSYGLMKQHGGAMALRTMRDIDQVKEDLRIRLNNAGRAKANPLRIWQNAVEAMNHISSVMDNAQRLATFHSALKQGQSPQQAALKARDATIDYQFRGLWSNIMGLWEPFFNTALRTGFRMGGAVSRSKIMRGVFFGTLAMGFAASFWNYFVGGKDKDGVPFFDKIPEWERAKSLIILAPWLPDAKGRPSAIKFPFPYNWAFPLSAGYGLGNMLWGSEHLGTVLKNMFLKPFVSTFSQIGEEGLGTRSIFPELARPEYDVASNTDWAGRPIHTDERYQKGPNAYSGKGDYGGRIRTGAPWKYLAETLNDYSGGGPHKSGLFDFYPEDIREVLSPFVGTQAATINEGYQTGKSILQGQAPAPTTVPLGRVFFGQDYDAANRSLAYQHAQEARHPWLR